MIPCSRYVSENWQDGNFVIVVPKNKGIMREKKEAEDYGERRGDEHAKRVAACEW